MKTLAKIFFVMIIGLASCKHIDCDPKPDSCADASPLVIDPDLFEKGPNDPFSMKEAEINGDCLETVVSYGGGCGGAEFTAVNSGAFNYSEPPQTSIRLAFDDQDFCEALITDTLYFDLSPLRFDNPEGTILIRLEGWEGFLEYNW